MLNQRTISTKEISKIFGVKRNMVNYLFRKSDIPTIHRDSNGNKTLMEKESFSVVFDVVTKIIETHTKPYLLSKKQKSHWMFMFFTNILNGFQNIDKTSQFTNVKGIALIDDLIDVIVLIDGFFERFLLIDKNTDEEYIFGKLLEDTISSNNVNHQSSPKSHHTVNGFWRNQPYGSRNNPNYKRIWVNSFERGCKKVG